jgi:hypothetical protein
VCTQRSRAGGSTAAEHVAGQAQPEVDLGAAHGLHRLAAGAAAVAAAADRRGDLDQLPVGGQGIAQPVGHPRRRRPDGPLVLHVEDGATHAVQR